MGLAEKIKKKELFLLIREHSVITTNQHQNLR